MALILAHESIGGVAFEYDLEAADGLGMELAIEEHFRFVVAADVAPGEGERVCEGDGELLDGAGVVVVGDFPLLSELDLFKVNGIEGGE